MIIDKIALTNFRVFRGFHEFCLTPKDKEHPIILIRALNGGGKTSLLDALKLVLYGKLANCSKKTKQSYSEFISDCINDQTPKSIGCSITMCFRTFLDGNEEKYKISRSWRFEGKSLHEKLRVEVNGKENAVVEKSWDEFVESFIPVKLSHLFFFDGEKIEEFASPESAKELLAQGIHSLLGIDTVSQLEKDLEIVVRKKQTSNLRSDHQKEELNQNWRTISDLKKKSVQSLDEYTKANELLQKIQVELESAKLEFKKIGGLAYQEKEQYEKDIQLIKDKISLQEKEAEDFASGVIPLVLLKDELNRLVAQANNEETMRQMSQVRASVSRIEELFMRDVERAFDDSQIKMLQQAFHNAVTSICEMKQPSEAFLNISSSVQYDLLRGLPELLQTEQKRIKKLLHEAILHLMNLDSFQKKIENIPAEEIVKPHLKRIADLEQSISSQTITVSTLNEIHHRDENDYMQEKNRFINRLESILDDEIAKKDDVLLVQQSKLISRLLVQFRNEMVTKYIGKIEVYIAESFRSLLHKESLVDSLAINKDTYDISIADRDNVIVNPDKLSAGERQLLGVSILWGLAKAAARPLPAVIDTPLGRLDSAHRENLVERYFPLASHQVILLSTNEEIYGEYYKRIQPFLSHAYTISYNDKNKSSNITKGYAFCCDE